ncbi:LysR family transcriptional regulator [Weissella oryzae SG25]|uniref:LysR family transcriptional regulator n=1 Tax=Weissella oryzae (strain DSM 25784 / JCM 18191 / LMG 30913 / SG25) TaxID=1329250 RepID=A0A069D0J7_WEIOS|nr:LysR family transcriptional regulator [Weissella oryzae]GAK30831.1 LysR family transcriptional regulator [Weissella oryzae SG25]
MEIRMMKYFLAVATTGTLTAAAKKLNLTQPALSRQIQVLETELGVQLLDRSKKPLQLTGEGIYFAKQAESILNLTEKTSQNLKQRNIIAGQITIGAAETSLFTVILAGISNLQDQYPDVTIHLISGSLSDMLDSLDQGLIDFLFALDFNLKGQYDYIDLKSTDTRGVYLNEKHVLANQKELTGEQIANYPIVISRNPIWLDYLSSITHMPTENLNIRMTFNLIGNASLYPIFNQEILLIGIEGLPISSAVKFIPIAPQIHSHATLLWKKTQFLSSLHEEFLYFINHAILDN